MNKTFLTILFTITVLLISPIFNAPLVNATGLQENLVNTGGQAYYNDPLAVPLSPTIIVAEVIKVVLGLIGILFTVLILYSGFQWMTAGGNTETITKAKSRIVNAIIGLVVILAAFTITEFVLDKIIMAV